jgi:DNA-binding transcriptional MocR family regulator
MVLPSKLLPLYDKLFQFETCPVAWIIQCALIRFIENHQYERLVYKNLRTNRKKYLAILQLFSDKFVQDVASLPYKTAGLHMVFELKDPAQATIFREKLSQKSLTLTSFDQYELNGITRNAVFIIGYAQYTTSELTDALNRLEKIFKELSALKSMKLSL